MPIKIPDDLPAYDTLNAEGVMVMRETDAVRQDIRPMRIGLLNLMPNKIRTETQIARLLAATPLQVELTLVRMTDHIARNTPADHMRAFYRPWSEMQSDRFDGFLITGAPVERMPFEEVGYWEELQLVLDWTQTHVHRTFTICWGAQAAVHHFHGMPKHALSQKAFGVYRQRNLIPSSPFMRGFSDDFSVPVSRWTETRSADIPLGSGLTVLADSEETGLCLLDDPQRRTLHMFNHVEYDSVSLAEEYARDIENGMQLPSNYFPDNDPQSQPKNRWRSHAHLLFGNWINEIYQTTPFDVARIGSASYF
ncbi:MULTISPECIES: homoserine O-succinyltransferase [unclassified Beijerinckia]|uniref:homoserine O-succinyltransferase n=1 Tax=unclassified Beijerinckia TaxID=2638183 RepID=UPI00089752B0|nr:MULTISPECIES: homoserine O-succinyltransferase [unclassified Beijerinckia]MDH7794075.1 homoserine O-succinyltransferase [Beijerinckia sp. GAS462]SEB52742.1 homoserine O-succinyltransferase [Beijerinckia sp. 28-YEA-48]